MKMLQASTRARAAAVALVSVLTVCTTATAASDPTSASRTCQRCHQGGVPVPAAHPKVNGVAITECTSCHASRVGGAKPNTFATRLHRAHVKAAADCTTCHAYAAGKRFAVMGHAGNVGSFDAAQYERVRNAMATGTGSPWLAAAHASKASLSCGACHQKQLIPDDNERALNTQCVSCHGSYEKLGPLTRAKLKNPDINPHASHLGPEIACTACHQGHETSTPYCVKCHTNFNMPIPGSAGKPASAAAAK